LNKPFHKEPIPRGWHGADTAMLSLRAIWYAIIVIYTFIYPIETKPAILQVVWVFLAFLVPPFFWRRKRMHSTGFIAFELLLMGGFEIWTVYLLGKTDTSIYISALLIGYIANRSNLWWAAPSVMGIEWLGVAFSSVPVSNAIDVTISSVVLLSIGYGIQRLVRADYRHQELLRILDSKNKTLRLYAERIETIASLEERNRLGRELHDSLGHSLITVIMGLDASIAIMEDNLRCAKEKLVDLRDYTADTLDDLRGFLHQNAYQDETGNLTEQLLALAKTFRELTAMEIRFKIEGAENPTPSSIQQAFIRCMKEALSNAARHGGATETDVTLTYSEKGVELCIRDNGLGADSIKFGFGLTAMQERMKSMDGTLAVQSIPGMGLELRCFLPVERN